MTKAERRKRARQRAREREKGGATAAPANGDGLGEAAEFGANATDASPEEESEFITGPVAPIEAERAAPTRLDVPRTLIGEAESEDDEDEDEDEDGEGDDDDEGPLDEEDALFQLACASIEEPEMSWNELVMWLLAVDIEDPRLALVTTLLVSDEDTPVVPNLSGERVLAAFKKLGLQDLVEEAREAVANAPKEEGAEADAEREIVRTSARELAALGKKELTGGGKKQKPGPVHASDIRAQKRGSESRESKRGGA